jgi:hypothetical protein
VIVKLIAPSGFTSTHVYTITGRSLMMMPGRSIEVTEEEAKPLRTIGFADA